MNTGPFPSRRLAACLIAAGALSLALAVLNGCTTIAGTSSATLVRVIDASQNAPALDAYFGTVPIAFNFVAPSVTNYAVLGAGQATVRVYAHGSTTAAAQLTGMFSAGEQHTVFVTDEGSVYQTSLLTDQSTPAPGGDISFRFLQQANATGPVDIYLLPGGTTIADAKPVLSALAPGAITPYINVAADTYQIVVAPTGTTTGAYKGTAVQYVGGQVRTVLIVDQQLLNSPPVNVLVADDVG